jgi:hypothetical protein
MNAVYPPIWQEHLSALWKRYYNCYEYNITGFDTKCPAVSVVIFFKEDGNFVNADFYIT